MAIHTKNMYDMYIHIYTVAIIIDTSGVIIMNFSAYSKALL